MLNRLNKLRRPRFGLPALLGVIVVTSIWLGIKASTVSGVRALQKASEPLHGHIIYEHEISAGKISGEANPSIPSPILDVVGETWFADPKILVLDHSLINDEDLAFLPSVDGMHTISLAFTKISDRAMHYVSRAPDLKTILVYNTGITDKSIKHLVENCPVECLDVRNTKVSDDGLDMLVSVKSLQAVYATGSRITPEGARRFMEARPECFLELRRVEGD